MANLDDTISAYALVAGVSAPATLLTLTPSQAGYYRVDVIFYTTGTTTGADADNVQLSTGKSTAVITGANGSTTANSVNTFTGWFNMDGLTQSFTLSSIAVSGGAANYHVQIRATRTGTHDLE